MSIVIKRVRKERNFTILDNTVMRDKELSWQAKGLHSFLMSCKDSFNITVKGLEAMAKNGKQSVSSILNELESFSYLFREQKKDEKGFFSSMTYYVYEHRQVNSEVNSEVNKVQSYPQPDFPVTGKRDTENQLQRRTKEIKTKEITTSVEEDLLKNPKQIREKREDLKGFSTMVKVHKLLTAAAGARFAYPKDLHNFKRYNEYRRVLNALNEGFTEQQLLDITEFAITEFNKPKLVGILSTTKIIFRLSQQGTVNIYGLSSRLSIEQRTKNKADEAKAKQKESIERAKKARITPSNVLELNKTTRKLEKTVQKYFMSKMSKDLALSKTQEVMDIVYEIKDVKIIEEYLTSKEKFLTLME